MGIAGRPRRCLGARMGLSVKVMGVFITTFLVRLYSGQNGRLMSFFSIGINLVCLEWGNDWGLLRLFLLLDFMSSIFSFPFLFITNQRTFMESRISDLSRWGPCFFAAICFFMGLFLIILCLTSQAIVHLGLVGLEVFFLLVCFIGGFCSIDELEMNTCVVFYFIAMNLGSDVA